MAKKDEAYNYLLEKIILNQLAPNEPISEVAVSETLKISRTPVREALRELESMGLIASYASRGSFVVPITPYDIEEICELRILLEKWALEHSLMKISDNELSGLENCFRESFYNQNWEQVHKADRQLHGLIIERSGSKRIQVFINMLNLQIERVRRVSAANKNRRELSFQEHLEIIKGIQERDIQKSLAALEKHLRSVADSAIEVAKLLES